MSDDTHGRVVRLETQVEHLSEQLSDMQGKVNAMHDLLMQAKGMRWLIVFMAAAAGFAASFASKYIPLSK